MRENREYKRNNSFPNFGFSRSFYIELVSKSRQSIFFRLKVPLNALPTDYFQKYIVYQNATFYIVAVSFVHNHATYLFIYVFYYVHACYHLTIYILIIFYLNDIIYFISYWNGVFDYLTNIRIHELQYFNKPLLNNIILWVLGANSIIHISRAN